MKSLTRNLAHGLLLMSLGGCAAMETYVGQRQDKFQGGPEARVQAAESRQAGVRATNTSLQKQLADLQQQQASLNQDLQATKSQLGDLNKKIASTKSATAAQKRDYDKLVAREKQLRAERDALAKQPPPDSAVDAAAQSLKLQRMRDEQEALQRQINALQQALS
jgi:chromosome segregation ATPase